MSTYQSFDGPSLSPVMLDLIRAQQEQKQELELNMSNNRRKRNALYVQASKSPGSLIFRSGGNGRINFSLQKRNFELENPNPGIGDVSFESNFAQDFDTVGIADESNLYHLHVKTGLLRFLQKTGRIGTMEKKLKSVFKEQNVLSIETKVAPVTNGIQERF